MPPLTRSTGSSLSPCSPPLIVVYICLLALILQAIMQQNVLTQLRSELEEMKDEHATALRKITKLSMDSEQEQRNSDPEKDILRTSISTDKAAKEQLEWEIPNYLQLKSPPNMPSLRMSAEEERKVAGKRKIYGGVGDKLHLGGFTQRDDMGISENLW